MRCVISKKPANGLTRMEVLAVITVLALLAIILPCGPGRRAKEKARQIQCLSNLRQVSVGFLSYALDHPNDRAILIVPPTDTQSQALVGFFRSRSNEFKLPGILWCPADAMRERATNWTELTTNHISYLLDADISAAQTLTSLVQVSELELHPERILSGDRNITGGVWSSNRLMVFSSASQPKWDKGIHSARGNLATLDGWVAQTTDQLLSNQFQKMLSSSPTNSNIRLAIP